MASVSIVYLDWNFIYFMTKACLKFVLATSQLGRGGERGGGTQGPGAPGSQVLQPLTLTPGSRPPPTGGLEGGGHYAVQWSDTSHWTLQGNAIRLAVDIIGLCIILLE